MNIIDRSYNKDTGELQQFTVITDVGQPDLKKATVENVLLYDPEDKLPFENGLRDFLNGDQALILSDEDPEVMIAPTGNEYCYILRVKGNTVETTPRNAEDVLTGVKEAVIDEKLSTLVSLYDEIMSTQVRRPVINSLKQTFDKSDRIEVTGSGWLIDGFYLVDWTASMYAATDDPEEKDVRRSGSGVVETDRSYEFVELRLTRDIEPVEVSIDGKSFRLSEREMLFLAKINWLLSRREYHPDQPFWKFCDRRADVDWKTGEPVEDDESDSNSDRDMGSFNL